MSGSSSYFGWRVKPVVQRNIKHAPMHRYEIAAPKILKALDYFVGHIVHCSPAFVILAAIHENDVKWAKPVTDFFVMCVIA